MVTLFVVHGPTARSIKDWPLTVSVGSLVRTTAVMESVLEVTVVTEGTPLVAVGLVAPPIAYCSCKAGVRLSPPLQLVKVSPEAVTVPLTAMLTGWLPVLVRATLPDGEPAAAEAARRTKRLFVPVTAPDAGMRFAVLP